MKIFFLLYFAVLIWSAINPKDYFTWFLEVIPAIIALIVLALTYRKFKLTTLIYSLF
jgi:putative membrane protein